MQTEWMDEWARERTYTEGGNAPPVCFAIPSVTSARAGGPLSLCRFLFTGEILIYWTGRILSLAVDWGFVFIVNIVVSRMNGFKARSFAATRVLTYSQMNDCQTERCWGNTAGHLCHYFIKHATSENQARQQRTQK